MCPKNEGRGLLEQVEVTHTTLKGGTALEEPSLALKLKFDIFLQVVINCTFARMKKCFCDQGVTIKTNSDYAIKSGHCNL